MTSERKGPPGYFVFGSLLGAYITTTLAYRDYEMVTLLGTS